MNRGIATGEVGHLQWNEVEYLGDNQARDRLKIVNSSNCCLFRTVHIPSNSYTCGTSRMQNE